MTSGTISIHALLAESDRRPIFFQQPELNFYPRSPCGERHPAKSESLTTYLISIHALLAESDALWKSYQRSLLKFLSTLSLRRATENILAASRPIPISIHALLAESDKRQPAQLLHKPHFYPRSPCGERQFPGAAYISGHSISIHALLAESDHRPARCNRRAAVISIHALLAESDPDLPVQPV